MSDTKEYVVISNQTSGLKPRSPDLKVGSTVELTEMQAANRVNKVRLKDTYDAETSKAGRKSNLEKANTELNARVNELEAQNKALHAEIQRLKA